MDTRDVLQALAKVATKEAAMVALWAAGVMLYLGLTYALYDALIEGAGEDKGE